MRDDLFTMLAYAKPVSGTMIAQGVPVQKDFYLENEWRYVPEMSTLEYPIPRARMEDEDQRKAFNKNAEKTPLTFTPADVRYIFVRQDADIPPLINHINDKLQHYSAVDLKILMSRVISLEHLENDI